MHGPETRIVRAGRIAGVAGALVGLAVIGVRSGGQLTALGATAVTPGVAGAAALLWLAWRLGALNARAAQGRGAVAVLATGAIGAVECLLAASLLLFCLLLSMMALGAGGDWAGVASLTEYASRAVGPAAAISALIGVGWGGAVLAVRR